VGRFCGGLWNGLVRKVWLGRFVGNSSAQLPDAPFTGRARSWLAYLQVSGAVEAKWATPSFVISSVWRRAGPFTLTGACSPPYLSGYAPSRRPPLDKLVPCLVRAGPSVA